MTAATPSDVARTSDVIAITDLLVRERHYRDRGLWGQMSGCFTGNAWIDMSWYRGDALNFIRRSSSMDVGGSRGVHRISPPVVAVRGDRAIAELPLVIEFRTDVEGVAADLMSFARSQYRTVRDRDGWHIHGITAIYERDTLTPAVPGTTLPLDGREMAELRASYRCLAWHMMRNGYTVPPDLPGDDEPRRVEAVYEREREWLAADDSSV